MAGSYGLIDSLFSSGSGSKYVFGGASFYLASLLLLIFTIQIIKERKRLLDGRRKGKVKRGVEAIPGPKGLPLIGNALTVYPMSETINIVTKLSKISGPCFKLHGPLNRPLVFLNSAENVEALLKSSDFGHVVKMPLAYDMMKSLLGNGVLVSAGRFWRQQRKTLLKSMSYQSLRSYIPMLNTHCQRFVDALDKIFADGQVHPINDLISSKFLEIICEMITGFDIHNSTEGVEYHHNFQIWKTSIAYKLVYPWFILSPIWRLHPMSWKNDVAVKNLFAFAKRRIESHRAKANGKAKRQNESEEDSDNSSPPPFRSVLDELVDAGASDHQIIDEVNTMIFGGHETGAGVIHLLCFSLALNPDIQEKCRREVDAVFDDPMQVQDGQMRFNSLDNLKYVERTILETLRLYPPVLIFTRQCQVPLNIDLNGETIEIPPGTDLAVYSFGLHRKDEYFPDPERFDPDRHVPEETAKRHAYSFVPFSMGPRNCLGLKFAMIELKMLAAYLIRNFDIQTTDRFEDVKLLPSLTLTPERDYNFIFKRRAIS